MAYTSNPFTGKTRRWAVNDVRVRGMSYAQVARKYGVVKSTICKWVKKADPDHRVFIPTCSSRPHHHPNELEQSTVNRIITLRKKYGRCAPVLHAYLKQEGISVSLSSVDRVLRRYHLTRRKKQAGYYEAVPRPKATAPGDLVQVDTIHVVEPGTFNRTYIYAVIDLYSRLGYVEFHQKNTQITTLKVIQHAIQYFGFPFKTVQTDNGPEFKDGLQLWLNQRGIALRHTRIRTPNDNAHVERFIRTVQDECLKGKLINQRTIRHQLSQYNSYYNDDRFHLGIGCLTPRQFVSKVLS